MKVHEAWTVCRIQAQPRLRAVKRRQPELQRLVGGAHDAGGNHFVGFFVLPRFA
jgi:hypothetical protein